MKAFPYYLSAGRGNGSRILPVVDFLTVARRSKVLRTVSPQTIVLIPWPVKRHIDRIQAWTGRQGQRKRIGFEFAKDSGFRISYREMTG
jgi:hypothetical protein